MDLEKLLLCDKLSISIKGKGRWKANKGLEDKWANSGKIDKRVVGLRVMLLPGKQFGLDRGAPSGEKDKDRPKGEWTVWLTSRKALDWYKAEHE